MILLNDVVHVLTGPALAFLRKQLFFFQITNRANVAAVLINIDHPWGGDVGPAQNFAEESLGRSSATSLIQEEVECLASRVNGSIQIQPLAFDLDVGLINLPRIVGLLQVWATAFIKVWSVSLNLAVDGRMID